MKEKIKVIIYSTIKWFINLYLIEPPTLAISKNFTQDIQDIRPTDILDGF